MDGYLEEIKDIITTFKGGCKGVVLSKRGTNDNHIIVTIITEDDGNWFVSDNHFSNYWLEDLQQQLHLTNKWIKNHCVPDIYEGRQYGYKLADS